MRTVVFLCLLAFGSTSHAGVIVGTATNISGFPFGYSASGFPGSYYQEIYAASAFPGPIMIAGIGFFGESGEYRAGTYTFSLSTTPSAPDWFFVSPFSVVTGPDDQVFGTYNLSGAVPFVEVVFQGVPFNYNPAEGNLLLDIRYSGPGVNPSGPYGEDYGSFDDTGNFSYPFTGETVGVAWDYGGNYFTHGLVTDFQTAVVPEPPASMLLCVGAIALCAFRLFSRRNDEKMRRMKMRSVIIVSVGLIAAAGLVGGRAQEALTNDAVVKMVKSGLGEGLVISMIQGQPGSYSLKPEELVKLKDAGVSEKILAAMAAKAVGGVRDGNGSGSGASVKVGLKTPVRLTVDETVSSKTAKPGDAIKLTAAEDVLIGGQVVIAKGAPATGRITAIRKKSFATHNGSLEFSVDSVRAVDGKTVAVEGKIATGGEGAGFGHFGKEAEIEKGYVVNAVVASEAEITPQAK